MLRRRGRDAFLDRLAPNCGSGVIVILVGLIATMAGVQQASASSVAFGSMLMLVPVGTYVVLRRLAARVVLERDLATRVFEGDVLEVRVRVHGRLPPPLFDLRLTERISISRLAIRTLAFGEPGPGDDEGRRSYRTRCDLPRGDYEGGVAYLRLGDPFGWFECRRALDAANRILVLPRIVDLPPFLLRALGVARPGPGLQGPGAGLGTELRGLRPYRPGDPRARIHWKQVARGGELIVREDDLEHEGGLVLILDRDLADDARGVGQTTLDRAARYLASVAVAARRLGQRLAFHDGDPAAGLIELARDQDMMIFFERLARLSLAETAVLPETLARVARELARPSRLQIVSTARSLGGLQLGPVILEARRRGHELCLVLLDEDGASTGLPTIEGVAVVRIPPRLLGHLRS
ncbi:MAG: DUF58 domain-containing protein [Planctomycetes bacterium]|nr:DUF58 domain-containing protein [Planctomycetota bacterium]